MKAIVDAPHKILLSGAYTVLDGYPALSIAVEPRLQVTVDLSLPEQWPRQNPFASAVREVIAATVLRLKPADLPSSWGQFSTSVDQTTHGWGLGSSAAFTSALLHALSDALGLSLSPDERFALARLAHRQAQRGQGSGLDIAASCFGGAVLASHAHTDAPPTIVRTRWPSDLSLLLIRSDEKADTRQMIDAYRLADPASHPHERRDLLRSIGGVTRALLHGGDLIAALAENSLHEERWSRRLGIPWVTPLQRQLQTAFEPLSKTGDLVIKALGAGGGDSIGCFYRNRALSLSDLAAILQPFPLQIRPIRLEERGLSTPLHDFSVFPLPSSCPPESAPELPPLPRHPSPGQF